MYYISYNLFTYLLCSNCTLLSLKLWLSAEPMAIVVMHRYTVLLFDYVLVRNRTK